MFRYFKSSILHVHYLQNLRAMNILDPIFYRTLFSSTIFVSELPEVCTRHAVNAPSIVNTTKTRELAVGGSPPAIS
jgi:hypothetical protein